MLPASSRPVERAAGLQDSQLASASGGLRKAVQARLQLKLEEGVPGRGGEPEEAWGALWFRIVEGGSGWSDGMRRSDAV